MSISMIAKKAFRPGGSGSPEVQPGSPFEVPGQTLRRLYTVLGWAEDAPAATVPFPVEPEKLSTVVVNNFSGEPVQVTVTPRRKYQRRNMVAED
jgi:hypothetical protein